MALLFPNALRAHFVDTLIAKSLLTTWAPQDNGWEGRVAKASYAFAHYADRNRILIVPKNTAVFFRHERAAIKVSTRSASIYTKTTVLNSHVATIRAHFVDIDVHAFVAQKTITRFLSNTPDSRRVNYQHAAKPEPMVGRRGREISMPRHALGAHYAMRIGLQLRPYGFLRANTSIKKETLAQSVYIRRTRATGVFCDICGPEYERRAPAHDAGSFVLY